MEFSGFKNEDFDLFTIAGFEERMEALKSIVRPKLEALGQHYSPTLTSLTGDEIFPHIAKHARRTVNPPKDTWVAFSSNRRGYKMLPHFQIGLWNSHLFIWFAVIYEAPQKAEVAAKFAKHVTAIHKQIPGDFVWSTDHMKPDAVRHDQMSKKDLIDLLQKVQIVKKAELLCGFHISADAAVSMSKEDFISRIDEVFNVLIPLYKLK